MDHQTLELTSPDAIRSDELQRQGEDLARQGDIERSHEVLVEALERAKSSGDERSIARAQYNLAESFKRRREGLPHENLIQAISCLEASRASSARKKDPFRYALTLDSLGQTRRNLAEIIPSRDLASKHLEEATRHLEVACEIVQKLEPFGLSPAAQYFVNLGNVWAQRGDAARALRAYRRAMTLYQRYRSSPPIPIFEPPADFELQLLVNLVNVLDPRKDWKEALQYCDQAEQARAYESDLRIDLARARILVMSNVPGHIEEGRQRIRSLQTRHMPHHALSIFAHLSHDAGDLEGALVYHRRARDEAMDRRQRARANHVADHHLLTAQTQAKQIAHIHASMGGARAAILAFLALENTSSMRYHDLITLQAYYPDSPVGMKLMNDRHRAAQLAALCQDWGGRLIALPAQEHNTILDKLDHSMEFNSNPGSMSEDIQSTFIKTLSEALETGAPVQELERESERWARESRRLDEILKQFDPKYGVDRPQDYETSDERLLELLKKHPDATFLRTCLTEGGILAVAIWLEGEALTGRIDTIAADTALLDVLREQAEGGRVEPEQTTRLDTFLSALDLGRVLEGAPEQTLYILPSLYTSIIPWAASGAPGSKLVDRFEAIIFLPMLTPLMLERAWSRPRQGSVTIAPGDALDHPTLHHSIAFDTPHEDELNLVGKHVTAAAIDRACRSANVVAFYTHGQRPEGVVGDLAIANGERYAPEAFARVWWGCERVELWACQTGVNLPHDFLTPAVDEAFGMDIAFQSVGVCSTIGTFWKVSDLITALMVREYRRIIARGVSAPEALVQAQRWWCDTAAPALIASLLEGDMDTAIMRAAQTLDISTTSLLTSLDSVLGPAKKRGVLDEADVSEIEAFLKHPLSWGGYRFSGVCGSTPERMNDAPEVKMTPVQEDEYRQLLDSPPLPDPVLIDEAFDQALHTARQLAQDRPPTSDQAIEVARLYALRRPSARRHNLLRGLAWLHEAIAREPFRQELCVEAAWLWYELAHGQLPRLDDIRSDLPDYAYIQRARGLLKDATGEKQELLGLLLDLLESRHDASDVLSRISGLLPNFSHDDAHARARALLAVAEVFQGHPGALELVSMLKAELSQPPETIALRCLFERIRCLLSHEDEHISPPDTAWLLRRHMRYTFAWFNRHVDPSKPEVILALGEHMSATVNLMDSDFWGEFFDPLSARWKHTGTPEMPSRQFVGGYITHKLAQGGEVAIPHVLATMAIMGDLRIAPMKHLAALEATVFEPNEREGPWTYIRLRREMLIHLEDSARLIFHDPEGTPGLHKPGAFDASWREVASVRTPRDNTAWILSQKLLIREGIDRDIDRIAAFKAERDMLTLEGLLETSLNHLEETLETAPGSLKERISFFDTNALAPDHSIERIQRVMLQRADDDVILGIGEGAAFEVVFVAMWRIDGVLHTREVTTELGCALLFGLDLSHLIAHVLENAPLENTAFDQLVNPLRASLESTLADAPKGRTISVIAPGMLRAIPWAGIIEACDRLHGRFSGVVSTLRFASDDMYSGTSPARQTLCLDGTLPSDRMTCFGHAVVSTRRSYTPGLTRLEPEHPTGSMNIDEVDKLEPRAASTDSLRIYARSSNQTTNASTQGLTLRHDRTMTTQNLSSTYFCGQVVEVWACSGNFGEARAVRDHDRDVMPEMVHALLISGAGAVLDIAWEIPDLTKAMVYEAYGRRAHVERGSERLLHEAISEVRVDFREWRDARARFATVADALRWLDERRRERFERSGVKNVSLSPFRPHHAHIEKSCEEFIELCTRPVYLAAFRWWRP